MKKFLNYLWGVLEFIVIIYVIFMTVILLNKNKYGFTQFGKYTFYPVDLIGEKALKNFKDGDLLIVKNSNDINVDDVLYYYAVYNQSYIVRSARVTNVESDDFSSLYTIEQNGLLTISNARVLGKEASVHHHLGGVLNVIESRIGFLFLVLLPILIIFIYQVYEFVLILRYEKSEKLNQDSSKEKEIEIL